MSDKDEKRTHDLGFDLIHNLDFENKSLEMIASETEKKEFPCGSMPVSDDSPKISVFTAIDSVALGDVNHLLLLFY